MSVDPAQLSTIKKFFSRLDTDNNRVINANDNIDESIKEALGLNNDNSKIVLNYINEHTFDEYNELYQNVTSKLEELKAKGEKPKMGLDDMQKIEETDPKTVITTPDGKEVPIKDFINELSEGLKKSHSRNFLYDIASKYGLNILKCSLPRTGNNNIIFEGNGVSYNFTVENFTGSGNIILNTGENTSYYTKQGDFIKNINTD